MNQQQIIDVAQQAQQAQQTANMITLTAAVACQAALVQALANNLAGEWEMTDAVIEGIAKAAVRHGHAMCKALMQRGK